MSLTVRNHVPTMTLEELREDCPSRTTVVREHHLPTVTDVEESSSNPTEGDNFSPRYSPYIWMISTRPTSRTDKSSSKTLLFQPDIRLFCHRGSSCRLPGTHRKFYEHKLPPKTSPPPTSQNPFSVPNCLRTWTLEEPTDAHTTFEFKTSTSGENREESSVPKLPQNS
eukprot:TRINITY_DN1061_c0_g1_i2.p1 TRINITY_DN1061_c0_g1~~TRINITY_DN1061_c0_g1_i2.p1  ORF type:complete len:168 (+),score=25.32 TRINITY_DN1061_c0_g1_i2:34-537(+)